LRGQTQQGWCASARTARENAAAIASARGQKMKISTPAIDSAAEIGRRMYAVGSPRVIRRERRMFSPKVVPSTKAKNVRLRSKPQRINP
jgi:acyl-CoA synthetase (NDP forming)